MLDLEPVSTSGLVGAIRRFGWGISDQALSSLTNFALSLLVARNVSITTLGVFALVFSTYLIALSLSRVFGTDPLVIRYSACSVREWHEASGSATGTAAMIGMVTGSAVALGGWIVGGSGGVAFIVLGASLPGLLTQDSWRFAFFARAKGGQAFLNDLVWALSLTALLAFVLLTGRDSLAWLIGAWGAAAGVAAIAGGIQARLVPAPQRARRWYRRNKDLSLPFFGAAIVNHGAINLGSYLIAAIAGLATLGALRAAWILLGPATMMIIGLGLVAVPEGARSLTRSREQLRRTSVGVSLAAGACALVWGLLVYSLPASIGRMILGADWAEAHSLMIPLTLAAVAGGATLGAASGLKTLKAAGQVLRTRMVEAAIVLCIAVIGASFGGAPAIAMAAAIGQTLIAALWWTQFRKTLRDRGASLTRS
jgi:O-antigen/teichoic acid export membrane protein